MSTKRKRTSKKSADKAVLKPVPETVEVPVPVAAPDNPVAEPNQRFTKVHTLSVMAVVLLTHIHLPKLLTY
jgi:hypothetical protein